MVDEFKDTLICLTKTPKRVRTEVSDSSTSDEESMTNKSSNISTDN